MKDTEQNYVRLLKNKTKTKYTENTPLIKRESVLN